MGQGFITRRGSGGGDSETAILTKVGSISMNYGYDKTTTKTLNISSIYPNYSKLSLNDILFPVTYVKGWLSDSGNSNAVLNNFTKKYDPNTGIITISATGSYNYCNAQFSCDIYIIERVPNPTYNGVPYGYILKTGTLALSSLDGSTYIPIGIKFNFYADDFDGSRPTSNLYDNLGTKLGQMKAPFQGSNWYIDLYSVYSGNIDKLKQWRKLSGWQGSHGNWFSTTDVSVVTWFEKV